MRERGTAPGGHALRVFFRDGAASCPAAEPRAGRPKAAPGCPKTGRSPSCQTDGQRSRKNAKAQALVPVLPGMCLTAGMPWFPPNSHALLHVPPAWVFFCPFCDCGVRRTSVAKTGRQQRPGVSVFSRFFRRAEVGKGGTAVLFCLFLVTGCGGRVRTGEMP